MWPVVHHLALVASIAALGGAGLRVASLVVGSGPERVLVAVVLAAAAAVAESLALALLGLGSSPVLLCAAAGLTWLAARRLAPAPRARLELAAWWRDLSPAAQIGAGALAGAWLAWTVWLLRYPALGIDSVTYHLPQIVSWVHSGSPGSVEAVLPGWPVGNFPLTNEVLVGWHMSIARSFVPAAIWLPVFMVLLALAGWCGLRRLRVPPVASGLAVALVCATPVLTSYPMNGTHNDLPALAWLAAAAALCAGVRSRPLLIAPALVAVGLSVGTKTTTAPLAALVLVLGLLAARGSLRSLARPLGIAALLAVAAGGVWSLRNLIDHGSPLWPHFPGPFGDPAPPLLDRGVSFAERPRATLEQLGGDYLSLYAGGILAFGGALVAPLLARDRTVLIAALAATGSLLLWTATPLSGVSRDPLLNAAPLSTLRYMAPGLAAAAVCLALAARRPGLARVFACSVLGLGVVAEVLQGADLGFPHAPSLTTPVAGAFTGALAAFLAARAVPRMPSVRISSRAAAAAAVLAVGLLLAAAAPGFGERHARALLFDSEMTTQLRSLPAYSGGQRTIAMGPLMSGPLAGDRIQHPLVLVPRRASCSAIRARLSTEWIVLHENQLNAVGSTTTPACLAAVPALRRGRTFRLFGPASGG